jgi:tetratricopeptide (TPR) repeat protein
MEIETNWLEFFEDRERFYANYYLAFAEDNARRDPQAYEQLEAESGNLLRVGAWLGEHDQAEGILQLAEALWQKSDFMRSRGYIQRGLPLLERARAAAQRLGNVEAEFVWLEALANVHYAIGNHASALPLYEQSLTLADYLGEPNLKAQADLGMGWLQLDMGHPETAMSFLTQALEAYRQVQDFPVDHSSNLSILPQHIAGPVIAVQQTGRIAVTQRPVRIERSADAALLQGFVQRGFRGAIALACGCHKFEHGMVGVVNPDQQRG